MAFPEYPTSDVNEIKQRLSAIEAWQATISARLDGQAEGVNSIGLNMQWMVEHLQGIFQMFASPQFMSQMSNMLMGGMANVGQAGPDATAAGPGTTSGADTGATGNGVSG